ncbi:hypothetical protein [Polyangium aurulentum]|uniref:hypothetical protein n=1 Tax=Polyangium aurulentum TaxID=2567896 RepID=UPI0010AEA299|nr:hypothetical protein [Polyangium aurulentum]UQA61650.1 hypothetical protein E8A73_014725 [Polyangium aurulentum]
MRKYRVNASSVVRVEYGIELLAGLAHFSETAPMVQDFSQLNDKLDAQHEARRALRKPLLEARFHFRFIEHRVDGVIRNAARAAEMADGGRRGVVTTAAFPDGVKIVVAPLGRAQVKQTRDLVDRLVHCVLPAVDAYRAEWLPKLQDALSELEAAAGAYDDARAAYLFAFNAERGLREAHAVAVDRLMGLVRAAFPRERALQDLVFPIVEDAEAELLDEPASAPPAPPPVSSQPV